MADILKGNFEPKTQVVADLEKPDSLEDRFEKAALKKLGGSIAYVAKKTVKWDLKDE